MTATDRRPRDQRLASQLAKVRVVLCRPANPMNLGAAARALRCAGLSRWAWVAPQTGDLDTARRVAVHAEPLLEEVQTHASLAEALAGSTLCIATSGKAERKARPLTPREAAEALLACEGEVALVFGSERDGLLAHELAQADFLSCIPSAPEQPSWNLAQAVAIYAHELRGAADARAAREPGDARKLASPDEVEAAVRAISRALPQGGRPEVLERLAATLRRAALSPREAQAWTSLLSGLAKRG